VHRLRMHRNTLDLADTMKCRARMTNKPEQAAEISKLTKRLRAILRGRQTPAARLVRIRLATALSAERAYRHALAGKTEISLLMTMLHASVLSDLVSLPTSKSRPPLPPPRKTLVTTP